MCGRVFTLLFSLISKSSNFLSQEPTKQFTIIRKSFITKAFLKTADLKNIISTYNFHLKTILKQSFKHQYKFEMHNDNNYL
jgi:hypothetical protein